MKLERYKPRRKERPKRKGNISAHKSQMLAASHEWKPMTSPQLREAYSTKIEWVKKRIPKLKEEAEAPEEKEETR
jgi:predicted HTH transcriptional regulator